MERGAETRLPHSSHRTEQGTNRPRALAAAQRSGGVALGRLGARTEPSANVPTSASKHVSVPAGRMAEAPSRDDCDDREPLTTATRARRPRRGRDDRDAFNRCPKRYS